MAAADADAGMVAIAEQRTLHREPYAYCAHPHLIAAGGGRLVLVFNRVPCRTRILHPPQDPEYRNVVMRSDDDGRSWSIPSVVPDYDWSGVECAGLTCLRSGRILLNQWKFEWLPLSLAERLDRPDLVWPERLTGGLDASAELDVFAPKHTRAASDAPFAWARGGGATVVHRSDDGGRGFTASRRIDTAPYSGGYGMRGAVELPDGDILLPLSDVPHYRTVFTVRSRDGGETWSPPSLVAEGPDHEFEEPAPLLLPSGRILLLLRDNISRILHAVHSDDGGQSWSAAKPTGIRAYPAHLLLLPDGRIACIAGQRHPPFGIVMHLSDDQGETWDERPTLLAACPNKDLGYPAAVLRQSGEMLVVYYAQDPDGITGIHALTTRFA